MFPKRKFDFQRMLDIFIDKLFESDCHHINIKETNHGRENILQRET